MGYFIFAEKITFYSTLALVHLLWGPALSGRVPQNIAFGAHHDNVRQTYLSYDVYIATS